MAGGLGTRLSGVVNDRPKCMADIDGTPFLWYLLKYLSRYDVGKVILSLGHLSGTVIRWLSEHEGEWPFEVDTVVEDHPLGTGGGLKLALSHAGDPHVAVLNGDTMFDLDLDLLMGYHVQEGAAVTLALRRMRDFDRYGTVVAGEDGVIQEFKEKQPCPEGLINGGVYIVDRNRIPWPADSGDSPAEVFSWEREVLERLCPLGLLQSVESDGYFIDIGVPEDYARARLELPRLFPASLDEINVAGYSAVLLDRDGVINELRRGDYVRRWRQFRFCPGVMEALAKWSGYDLQVYVITNQRGVGKGLMSREVLDDIHNRMCQEIEKYGGHIDGVYVCTAVSDDDPCRKPNIGMFEQLLSDHPDLDPGACLMIGDSASDALFAERCGVDFVRL